MKLSIGTSSTPTATARGWCPATSSSSSSLIKTSDGSNRTHGVGTHPALRFPLRTSPSRSNPSGHQFPLSSRIMVSASQVAAPGDVDSGAVDVYDVIRAHQQSAARLSTIEEIRTFLNRSGRGMLSTFSKDNSGYPSGSMVDFACDQDGSPLLAVSGLAVHAKNLQANPKCSLLVARDPEDRTDLVVTIYGDAIYVSEKDQEVARAAYLKKHPGAFWVDFGDFRFVRIEPKSVHFVSGVATALLGSGDFTAQEYSASRVDPISEFSYPITSHMNKDHGEETKLMVQHSTSVMVDNAYMLDVDSLGFNVKAGYKKETFKLRIPFPRQAMDRKDVKNLIVEMLQAARASESKA